MAIGTNIGIGLAAIGAIAAAVFATASARGVALSRRPYVYGEQIPITFRGPSVQLHNDGPGHRR